MFLAATILGIILIALILFFKSKLKSHFWWMLSISVLFTILSVIVHVIFPL